MKIKRLISLLPLVAILLTALSCSKLHNKSPQSDNRTLEQLKDSGELVALTLYGPTSYFIYRGQEMGYQYELSKQFADYLGLKLRVEVAKNVPDLIEMLNAGKGDLIAYNLPINKEWRDSVLYCGEEFVTHQVIVQQKNSKSQTLKDVTELIGKDIYVKTGKHSDRLRNLNDELGGGITIHEITGDSTTVEDLIRQVSEGSIPMTVADYDFALINATYYPNLNIRLSISFDQRSSWAVNKDFPELATAVNDWYNQNVSSPAYKASAKRYFEIGKTVSHPSILSLREGRISHYDEMFKKYANDINWDWRLLASLAYTESNFDTAVVSWAGAKGLMQLMPRTAAAFGVPAGRETNAEESIKAAVKYIASVNNSLRNIPEENERLYFILASYNAGLGHINDAIALANKYGKDKAKWYDNVEKFILLKSNEEYYTDPVCKNGYFRGTETHNFVRDVMERYEIYKDKIPAK